MQLTLTPTGTIENVQGHPHRVWRGTTEKGVPVLAWVAMVSPQTHDAEANAEFARELQELKVERQPVSFDYRMVVD